MEPPPIMPATTYQLTLAFPDFSQYKVTIILKLIMILVVMFDFIRNYFITTTELWFPGERPVPRTRSSCRLFGKTPLDGASYHTAQEERGEEEENQNINETIRIRKQEICGPKKTRNA